MRPFVAAVATLLTLAAPLAAQDLALPADPVAPSIPRWHLGVAADLGIPTGALKQQIGNAGGLQAHLRLRLDQYGLVALRMQGGWLNYGHESQRSCLAATPGCRVAVNVNTVNGILSFGIGPEFAYQIGKLRAYGHGLVGMSRFSTVSGIGGGIMPDIVAGDENFGDNGFTWSSGAGLQLPISRRIALDLGIDYQGHGDREYLTKGGITDNADGSLTFNVKRSTANLVAIRFGVTSSLGWGSRKPKAP